MQIRNNLRNIVVGTASALGSVAAFAQGDPFTTAMTEVTGKVQGYGAALVGLAAVGVAFYVAIKFVKKIPKAA